MTTRGARHEGRGGWISSVSSGAKDGALPSTPASAKILKAFRDEAPPRRGNPRVGSRYGFATYTLKYNDAGWVLDRGTPREHYAQGKTIEADIRGARGRHHPRGRNVTIPRRGTARAGDKREARRPGSCLLRSAVKGPAADGVFSPA